MDAASEELQLLNPELQVYHPFSMKRVSDPHEGHHETLRKNYCFGCGRDNPDGMQLKFTYDEAGKRFISKFRLSRRYSGPPGHAHGGIIATILDEAMGKMNKVRKVVALTKEMTVEYLKPVPLGQSLVVEGRNRSVRGRVLTHVAEIRNSEGLVLARSRGKFIVIDPAKVFARHVRLNEKGEAVLLPLNPRRPARG